jgi:hypothetical protein
MTLTPQQDDWDRWPFVLNGEAMAAVRAALEETPVIVEHRFYRGSRAPERLVFDDIEAFEKHVHLNTGAGDSIWVWRFSDLCRDDNAVVWGKVPDQGDRVPKSGAY